MMLFWSLDNALFRTDTPEISIQHQLHQSWCDAIGVAPKP